MGVHLWDCSCQLCRHAAGSVLAHFAFMSGPPDNFCGFGRQTTSGIQNKTTDGLCHSKRLFSSEMLFFSSDMRFYPSIMDVDARKHTHTIVNAHIKNMVTRKHLRNKKCKAGKKKICFQNFLSYFLFPVPVCVFVCLHS